MIISGFQKMVRGRPKPIWPAPFMDLLNSMGIVWHNLTDFDAFQRARTQHLMQVLHVVSRYICSGLNTYVLLKENAFIRLWGNVRKIKSNHPDRSCSGRSVVLLTYSAVQSGA